MIQTPAAKKLLLSLYFVTVAIFCRSSSSFD